MRRSRMGLTLRAKERRGGAAWSRIAVAMLGRMELGVGVLPGMGAGAAERSVVVRRCGERRRLAVVEGWVQGGPARVQQSRGREGERRRLGWRRRKRRLRRVLY